MRSSGRMNRALTTPTERFSSARSLSAIRERVPHHRPEGPEDDVRALAEHLGVPDLEALGRSFTRTPVPAPRG